MAVSSWKTWIAERFGTTTDEDEDPEQARSLAVAALLVEVLRADYNVSDEEQQQVLDSMGSLLGIDVARCKALFAGAESEVDAAYDLHQFTSRLNRLLTHAEKLELIEHLWRVAHADAVVHKYEEHLIRRVADLLYVSHREFIAAKLRAAEATTQGGSASEP